VEKKKSGRLGEGELAQNRCFLKGGKKGLGRPEGKKEKGLCPGGPLRKEGRMSLGGEKKGLTIFWSEGNDRGKRKNVAFSNR